MFKDGELVEKYGSQYRVTLYEMSDEQMKEHNLIYKNRVNLKKVIGINGMSEYDFAMTE